MAQTYWWRAHKFVCGRLSKNWHPISCIGSLEKTPLPVIAVLIRQIVFLQKRAIFDFFVRESSKTRVRFGMRPWKSICEAYFFALWLKETTLFKPLGHKP